MQNFLAKVIAVLSLIGLSTTAYADSDPSWLLQNLKNAKVVARYAQGMIDGIAYTVIEESTENSKEIAQPVIVIIESRGRRHKVIAEVDLGASALNRVSIKHNSIFIRYDYAHHGIRFNQYQFKRVGMDFKLIGMESQDMSLSDYIASDREREAPDFKSQEMWSGTSTNFLNSRGECWLKMIGSGDSPVNLIQQKKAYDLFDRGARPKDAVVGEIRFAAKKLLPLSKFDPLADSFYPSCYFDHKRRLHKIAAPPK